MKCKYTTWLSSEQYLHGPNHENNKYEFNKSGDLSHTGEGAVSELNLRLSY